MVVAPTRVLAEQIYKVLLELIRGTPLKARILTGSRQTNFQPTTRIGDRHWVQKLIRKTILHVTCNKQPGLAF